MSREILLVGTAREKSDRCHNKMSRYFHNTTLFDIYMEKLETIKKQNNNIFDDIIIAVSKYDKVLWDKANSYSIKIHERDKHSVTKATSLSEIHYYLKDYEQEYIMWLNGSSPFITPDTILFFGDFFKKESMESLHLIKRRLNWFWLDNENKPINVEKKTHSRSQECQPIYESLQSFHIYNRQFMLENDAPWDFSFNNPYLYKIGEDSIEYYDIDTEEEFHIAEKIYMIK